MALLDKGKCNPTSYLFDSVRTIAYNENKQRMFGGQRYCKTAKK